VSLRTLKAAVDMHPSNIQNQTGTLSTMSTIHACGRTETGWPPLRQKSTTAFLCLTPTLESVRDADATGNKRLQAQSNQVAMFVQPVSL
jgi:hypothetical protein